MSSIRNAEEKLVSELQMPKEEARVYLLLLARGRMAKNDIARELEMEPSVVERATAGLIEKGACIAFGSNYEALNPRFAVTNIYRMMCYAKKIEVGRNVIVDQLAAILEKVYEDARTK